MPEMKSIRICLQARDTLGGNGIQFAPYGIH